MTIEEFVEQCKERQQRVVNALKSLEMQGIKLPMTPEEIYIIESEGDVVDLETGAIIKGGATMQVDITEQGVQIANEASKNAKPFRRTRKKP